jgi:hypothetical protein
MSRIACDEMHCIPDGIDGSITEFSVMSKSRSTRGLPSSKRVLRDTSVNSGVEEKRARQPD